ncbi:TonB family C-terminal domain-containing protein [Granulicella rosea]|uniref:TonB family C-terminal domain-containing protein n=1 Tax=Granulicella rosea TaxID=474952 RepID=A0A239LND0_9BACT|nr:cell envelope integrity protein TolA [Granulicella rosea]SNT31981.1 TonB family C-terminal domain-containing protein [Granulicella rosea]
MPELETPPNPVPPPPPSDKPAPIKLRTGRFGELEEHELIHLIDTLDDERSRARFRESIYISIFVYIILTWLAVYGVRWLPHGPRIANAPIKEEHESNMMANLSVPKDLQKELARHPAPPTPKPAPPVDTPQPAPAPQPQQQAPQQPQRPQPQAPQQPQQPPPPQNTRPTPTPPTPAPAPQPQQQAMVDAPRPSFQQPNQSPGKAIEQAAREAARNQQTGGGAYSPNISGGGRAPLGSGAEILTDTQGVDFGPYMRRAKSDIYRNWQPLIPESVYPPISKHGVLAIRMTILSGGKIGSMTLETTSGDVALNRAAWSAITSEGTFPPLPKEFPGPSIDIRWTFFYNQTPQ